MRALCCALLRLVNEINCTILLEAANEIQEDVFISSLDLYPILF